LAPQPEQQARGNIDRLLEAAGWHVCDAAAANIHAARGVAIREFPLPGYGFADYLLYVDGKAAGVIEAKKEGVTLTGVETPSTRKLWIYDLRTNMHFTLKTSTLKREDLDEFVKCYNPANRHDRKATWSPEAAESAATGSARTGPEGRWRAYDYEELINRDKASLDIFWLKDQSLSGSDNLPAPEVIAAEIVEDLEAALEQFREILADMGPEVAEAAE
jgi:type I restriction enzyme M protein